MNWLMRVSRLASVICMWVFTLANVVSAGVVMAFPMRTAEGQSPRPEWFTAARQPVRSVVARLCSRHVTRGGRVDVALDDVQASDDGAAHGGHHRRTYFLLRKPVFTMAVLALPATRLKLEFVPLRVLRDV